MLSMGIGLIVMHLLPIPSQVQKLVASRMFHEHPRGIDGHGCVCIVLKHRSRSPRMTFSG